MSSDYLNYELSKQLQELGVVFENPVYFVDKHTRTSHPDEFTDKDKLVISPSTAQLIDMLALYNCRLEINTWDEIKLEADPKYSIYQDSGKGTSWFVSGDDKCCTTALGQALVELVKGESDE